MSNSSTGCRVWQTKSGRTRHLSNSMLSQRNCVVINQYLTGLLWVWLASTTSRWPRVRTNRKNLFHLKFSKSLALQTLRHQASARAEVSESRLLRVEPSLVYQLMNQTGNHQENQSQGKIRMESSKQSHKLAASLKLKEILAHIELWPPPTSKSESHLPTVAESNSIAPMKSKVTRTLT